MADIPYLLTKCLPFDDLSLITKKVLNKLILTSLKHAPQSGYPCSAKATQLHLYKAGDYLVFLNAGDTLYAPDTIETVVQKALSSSRIEEKKPAVIYGDTAITDSEGHFLHLRTHRPPEHLTWKSFKKGMLVCHQAFYVRTDIARDFPYDLQYRHSADVDWCIRIMREADRQHLLLVNTHAILANFEEGGDTTQHHHDSLKERFKIMMHHYGLFQTVVMHAWFILRLLFRAGTHT